MVFRYPGNYVRILERLFRNFFAEVDWDGCSSEEVGHDTCYCRVKSAKWSTTKSTWTIEVEGGSTVESEILINGSGILNDAQMPAIEGLSSFAGPLLHTAMWDNTVDLTGKRIGVIGAGASAIQMLPKIQPIAKNIQVYIRTPSIEGSAR